MSAATPALGLGAPGDRRRRARVRRVAVVTAGLSEPSSTRLLADLLAEATAGRARAGRERRGDVELRAAGPRPHRRPADRLRERRRWPRAQATVAAADAVIAVTPVFSASYSGLFKTFFDVLEPGTLDGVPVLVAATAGTARHSPGARARAAAAVHLPARRRRCPPASSPRARTGAASGADGALRARIDRAAGELADLVSARPPLHRADPFGDVPDFSSLLGG